MEKDIASRVGALTHAWHLTERSARAARRVCRRLEQRVGVGVAAETLDDLAAAVDQELLEVPRDVRAAHRCPERDGSPSESASWEDEGVDVRTAVALRVGLISHRDHHLRLEPLEKRHGV